jgi:hypothetical protein
MEQPGAKQQYNHRQSWVEPVFSTLRGCQGLNRFRRKGLTGVKTEFALHILAYNLGRAVVFWSHSLLYRLKRQLYGQEAPFPIISAQWSDEIQFDCQLCSEAPG